jgi:hypothetical protein
MSSCKRNHLKLQVAVFSYFANFYSALSPITQKNLEILFCAFSLCTKLLMSCLETSSCKRNHLELQVAVFSCFAYFHSALSPIAQKNPEILFCAFSLCTKLLMSCLETSSCKRNHLKLHVAVFSYFTYFHSALSPIAHKTPFPMCICAETNGNTFITLLEDFKRDSVTKNLGVTTCLGRIKRGLKYFDN